MVGTGAAAVRAGASIGEQGWNPQRERAHSSRALRRLRQLQAHKCERHPAWIGMAFVVPA